jgi:high-affinity iron transporter
MLLNAVIITLREVLEAALLTSMLLVLCQLMKKDKRWVILALGFGLIGAYAYASNIQTISNLFEGVGQEILNAGLHCIIFLALFFIFISSRNAINISGWPQLQVTMMILAVIVSSGREGAEIILYIQGFLSLPDMLSTVLIGSIVGAGIGLSIGLLFYYLLISLPVKIGLWLALISLTLVGGSMMSQAVQLLIQADILTATIPIWNSSELISERSVVGQLLYALVGYEATPTFMQVIAYGFGIMSIATVAVMSKKAMKGSFDD